jgi:hypothetical protein
MESSNVDAFVFELSDFTHDIECVSSVTLCDFCHRHAQRLGCCPDAFAARAGVRLPKDGKPRSVCAAPVLPSADHAGLPVRPG